MAMNWMVFDWLRRLLPSSSELHHGEYAELGDQHWSGPVEGLPFETRGIPKTMLAKSAMESLGVRLAMTVDTKSRGESVDLNEPIVVPREVKLVTNFGTSEHVFDQAQLLETCHRLCAVGGLMVHVVPMAGDLNHGFFNYQPGLFVDLASTNSYQIVALDVVPMTAGQQVSRVGRRPVIVSLGTDTYERRIRDTVRIGIARIRVRGSARLAMRGLRHRSFWKCYLSGDYLFVALRKRTDLAFVTPMQCRYRHAVGGAPPPPSPPR